MIIVVGGIKGGTGKTTIATNLAVCGFRSTYPTLLVDADEQNSASDWAHQRPDDISFPTISLHGGKIHRELQEFQSTYKFVIIDVGGRDTTTQRSALTVADVFLVPFKPRSFDIWTLGSIRDLIEEVTPVNPKLKCFYTINQGDNRGPDNDTAIEFLSEFPSLKRSTIIGHRKAFADAASEGLGVIEMKKKDEKANDEIQKLWKCIYKKHT